MKTERVHHPRSCGTCHACCVAPQIDELNKPEHTACAHLRPGNVRGACGIYGKRPDTCRAFFCAWLLAPEMPDELRPDKSGIVLKPTHPEGGQPVMEIWETTPDTKWEDSAVAAWFWSLPQSTQFKLRVRRYVEPE